MNYPKYDLINTPENTRFYFISIGSKEDIELSVLFTLVNDGFYNLAFGRITAENEIDDLIVVNNGDRDKILATVAEAAFTFFNTYPDAIVYFSGSTESRTRLYKRAISLNLNELEQTFTIYGITQAAEFTPEVFVNNKNYNGFLVTKKI